jgi:branched-chain amino acid transport system substrate-binding protein
MQQLGRKRSQSKTILQCVCTFFAWIICLSSFAADKSSDSEDSRYKIYLDADQSNSVSSGRSIEQGIRAAFHEVNWKLGGYPVELVIKDHRGSTPRSQYHLQQFIDDPMGLVVFGGLHSPPLISSRAFINQNQILTLVPWAAATPITRPETDENWIFRLSIDDSKAGEVIIRDAIKSSSLKAPFLLLEDTGWGRANQKAMTAALAQLSENASGMHYFQWGTGHHEARSILEKAINDGADSFVLVANAPEGVTFAKAMLSLDKSRQRPLRSHWGITGGNFFESLGASAVSDLDLRFIQTSFSFMSPPLSETATQALNSLANVRNTKSISPEDVKSPAGFIHAYDLTRLLIAAAESQTLTGDAKLDHKLIKQQLENLTKPVVGLIKTYQKPFSHYDSESFDAHEALGADDFKMAQYDKQGNIRLITSPQQVSSPLKDTK